MTPPLTLPRCLSDTDDLAAITLLRTYFAVDGPTYTGASFDTFDPSGTRANSGDVFTADDLLSVSLLSVDVPGSAVLAILGPLRPELAETLEAIGDDRDLADVESVDEGDFHAWRLWRLLRSIPGLGPTTVSKLMARKRPRLIPIFDSVIDRHVLGGNGRLWVPLHAVLRADGGELHRRLLDLRTSVGLDERVSALRIFDVLAWMEGRQAGLTDDVQDSERR